MWRGVTAWKDSGALLLLTKRSNERPGGARTKATRNHKRATARWWVGRLVGTRVSGIDKRALTGPSLTFNDEDCFVVNAVLFSNLPQMVVVFCRVFQQRIADISS